ncbi:MAG: transcriptional repressor [Candidatus Cloacimonetes bacterium]|nr:transcriptional repressor [Candidatus Cloacimonadota bacterium]
MEEHEGLFRSYLDSRSLKMTRPRKIILEAVFAIHEHFDVDILYDRIRKKHRDVSRATIYRTLPLLVESGLIKQSLRCQAKDHYEHIFGHKQHLHFICNRCGRIFEVDSSGIEQDLRKLASGTGFRIEEINIEANGLCSDCGK